MKLHWVTKLLVVAAVIKTVGLIAIMTVFGVQIWPQTAALHPDDTAVYFALSLLSQTVWTIPDVLLIVGFAAGIEFLVRISRRLETGPSASN